MREKSYTDGWRLIMETIFGPVPSRRLGRSIGINNVPPKHCTYSCVYCQLGRAVKVTVDRKAFYNPEELYSALCRRLDLLETRNEVIDYLTIVPDGEPTLDRNIGRLLELLKKTGIPSAVITNGSLLGDPSVREELMGADWISIKVDAVTESVWRNIDRPHRKISHEAMLEGALEFAHAFSQKPGAVLTTESMLVEGINTAEKDLQASAEYVGRLSPDTAYISIPTRPPAETWVQAASESSIAKAYSIFSEHNAHAEHLTGYEGNVFSFTGNAAEDILSITAVHPMREDAVRELLEKDNSTFSVVDKLTADNKLLAASFNGHTYYVRRFRKHQRG